MFWIHSKCYVDVHKGYHLTSRDRTYVLSLLMQCYSKRTETLIGGLESDLNTTKHIRQIKNQESDENNPLLQSLFFKHY